MNDLAPAQTPPVRHRGGRLSKAVRLVSLVDLAVVILAVGILWIVSERTWWGTVFTFVPRHPFLVAPALLLVFSALADRRSIVVNAAALALVAGPLMGGNFPLTFSRTPTGPASSLKIVSCNVEYFQPGVESVIREIKALAPDVVALQEAMDENPLLPRYFPGWHVVHEDQFWIGSRFPLHRIDSCNTRVFPHETAVSVRIDAPEGSFILHDVHLTTPRYGLVKITLRSVLDGSGPRELEEYTERRRAEALKMRAYVDAVDAAQAGGRTEPVVIVGDFNTPSVSRLYRDAWTGFTNAFEAVGFGFGYTAPCTDHRYWFNDVPWVRIDHILADDHCRVSACGIGRSKGSDHRLVWALLSPGK
jgi:endonuclease/exonuclease/phosphatase (EEP) superfamily protein YafD